MSDNAPDEWPDWVEGVTDDGRVIHGYQDPKGGAAHWRIGDGTIVCHGAFDVLALAHICREIMDSDGLPRVTKASLLTRMWRRIRGMVP